MNNRHIFFLIFVFAAIILFVHLGMPPLRGSEGRWAVIARYMYTTGNIFNPMLGIAPYWDKPLLSYWQILPMASMMGGVSELTTRIPSALWALLMLFLTYDLAQRWFDQRTALASAFVLCTSYGFVLWGRNAQVELTNAALIMLSIWYFFKHRADTKNAWIYVLGVLMAIGTNMKGLTACAVPIFCILCLSLVKRDWAWVPPAKVLFPAAIVASCVFLVVPLLGSLSSSSWEPLRLILRENVVRFFQPFDHKDPVYVYFYRIFDLAAPWSLLLPPALFFYLQSGRYRESRIFDILLIFGSVLLFFTLAGSRRPYYILPILPFAAIIIGDFLSRFLQGSLPSGFSLATKGIGICIGLILTMPLVLLVIKPYGLPAVADKFLFWAIALCIGALTMIMGSLKKQPHAMLLPAAFFWLIYTLAFIPWVAAQPGNLREEVARLVAMQRPVGFLETDDAKIIFYLNRPYAILPDLQTAQAWAARSGGFLIAYDDIQDPSWERLMHDEGWKVFRLRKAPQHPTPSVP